MGFKHVTLAFINKVVKYFYWLYTKFVKMLNKMHFKVVSMGLNQVLFFSTMKTSVRNMVFYPLLKISYLCFIGYEIFGLNSVKI